MRYIRHILECGCNTISYTLHYRIIPHLYFKVQKDLQSNVLRYPFTKQWGSLCQRGYTVFPLVVSHLGAQMKVVVQKSAVPCGYEVSGGVQVKVVVPSQQQKVILVTGPFIH